MQNHRMQVHRTGRTGTGTHLDTEASTLFEVLDSCTNFSATTSLFLRYKLKKVVHVAVELNSSITACYLLSHILPVLNPSFSSSLLSYVPPFLHPSFLASLLLCIPPVLHLTCLASYLYCCTKIKQFRGLSGPALTSALAGNQTRAALARSKALNHYLVVAAFFGQVWCAVSSTGLSPRLLSMVL